MVHPRPPATVLRPARGRCSRPDIASLAEPLRQHDAPAGRPLPQQQRVLVAAGTAVGLPGEGDVRLGLRPLLLTGPDAHLRRLEAQPPAVARRLAREAILIPSRLAVR